MAGSTTLPSSSHSPTPTVPESLPPHGSVAGAPLLCSEAAEAIAGEAIENGLLQALVQNLANGCLLGDGVLKGLLLALKDFNIQLNNQFPNLTLFSQAFSPKNPQALLPEVDLFIRDLKRLGNDIKPYRVVQHFAKALESNSGMKLPINTSLWLAEFAIKAGLCNYKTNPLCNLEASELNNLSKVFPWRHQGVTQPIGPLDQKDSFAQSIELAKLKKVFLEDPIEINSRNLALILYNDQDVCLAAVEKYGLVLGKVADNLRTKEICLVAVKQNGSALGCVPNNLRTEEICLAAVKQNGSALKYVPGNLITEEICLAAVKQDGSALQYTPENLRTNEICLAAVEQNGYALRYVPDGLRTLEICRAAVETNGNGLDYVPDNIIRPEMYLSALKQFNHAFNPHCFGYRPYPDKLRSIEILCKMLRAKPSIVLHLPICGKLYLCWALAKRACSKSFGALASCFRPNAYPPLLN